MLELDAVRLGSPVAAAGHRGPGCLAKHDREELGVLFQDADFPAACPVRGGPGLAPGMLDEVSAMQFAERLTGRQAADAVRGRIGWKYVL
ncbi:hypothetical protein ACFRLW_40560, partial [Streptomyces sp. NPDC056728]